MGIAMTADQHAEADLILPIVHVVGRNLPEAWEAAVIETWERGAPIATQYDAPGDPPSRDALAVIAVADPFAEPRIHRGLPGGIEELEAYRQEVVDGIHDHWVDPAAGKWEYTYHDRLVRYAYPGGPIVDQLEQATDALIEAAHTRRAQAIIWKPWEDAGITDPPCLQRMWFRIFGDRLAMNVHMRSNDGFKAAFMNMYAFTDIQRVVAERVSERTGRAIRPGQYTHIADSFHIYGSYFAEFGSFLELVRSRSFERRTFRTEEVADMIEAAREAVLRSIETERREGRKGL
jgi:thymidylate synthase